MNVSLQKKQYKESSLITRQTGHVYVHPPTADAIKKKNWKLVMASQFLIVNSLSWNEVRETFWEWLPKLSEVAWESLRLSAISLAPDEFVIQTLLHNKTRCRYIRNIVYCDCDDSGAHASVLSHNRIIWNVRDAILNNPPLCFGVRKVKCALHHTPLERRVCRRGCLKSPPLSRWGSSCGQCQHAGQYLALD